MYLSVCVCHSSDIARGLYDWFMGYPSCACVWPCSFGPSGLAAAARASTYGLHVVVIDPEPLLHWPNNYGVWIDEFEKIGLEDNLDFVWNRANVFLGERPEDHKTLSRPYGRVDRAKLKTSFLSVCLENGVREGRREQEEMGMGGHCADKCTSGNLYTGRFAF